MIYDRRRGIYVGYATPEPKAYEFTKNGNTCTPKELRVEWECSVEWGYTHETYDEWRERLLRLHVIKAIY